MFGYIYKTTDLSNGKIYVGQKKSDTFLGIDYIGSGVRVTQIKDKLLKEGVDIESRFKVELIDTANDRFELNEKEIYWIEALDARNPAIGYNMAQGGGGGVGGPMMLGKKHSPETKARMSESRRGEKNSNYGNHWTATEEQRKHYSEATRGEKNPMYGKQHSQESLDKMRSIKVGKYVGWRKMNNGSVEVMIPPDKVDEYLDNGFSFGMLPYKRTHIQ